MAGKRASVKVAEDFGGEMKKGHFHLHVATVPRASGASAVAAAAYQANQDLMHRQQRCFELGIEYRKALGSGVVSDELRRAFQESRLFRALEADDTLREGELSDAMRETFAQHGVELSSRCQLHVHLGGVTLFDKDRKQTYQLRSDGDEIQVYQEHYQHLSPHATVEKLGRREWRVVDGEQHYRIKEFSVRRTNKKTGKREVVKQGLDVFADQLHCYSRKGDVVESWVRMPALAPDWMQEIAASPNPSPELRAALWNAAEEVETARNGRPARKVEMALSRELTYAQNRQCVEAFVDECFTRHDIIADIAIHEKEASDGEPNLHAHILITTRALTEAGKLAETKSDYWNSRQRVRDWRAGWAGTLNRKFEELGLAVRVDHRSYADQGIEKVAGLHLGPTQWAMEQKAVETEKGDRNRDIRHDNLLLELAQNYAEPELEETAQEPEEQFVLSERDVQLLESVSDAASGSADTTSGSHINAAQQALEEPPENVRRVREDEALDRQHRQQLQMSMSGRVRQSLTTVAEQINRLRHYGRAAIEKAKAMSRSVFDRYAESVMHQGRTGRGREREEMER